MTLLFTYFLLWYFTCATWVSYHGINWVFRHVHIKVPSLTDFKSNNLNKNGCRLRYWVAWLCYSKTTPNRYCKFFLYYVSVRLLGYFLLEHWENTFWVWNCIVCNFYDGGMGFKVRWFRVELLEPGLKYTRSWLKDFSSFT